MSLENGKYAPGHVDGLVFGHAVKTEEHRAEGKEDSEKGSELVGLCIVSTGQERERSQGRLAMIGV